MPATSFSTDVGTDRTTRRDPIRKVIIASAAGNALEWFDFSSYAFFATYISLNFFVQGDTASGMLSTFVVFGAGFIARPLGALVLGNYGDTHGRKATLILTVTLMAIGTFIIGFAPPVWAIGIGAPILLLVGRLFQGFSAGGEIGGAASYLLEKAPRHRRAEVTCWLQASMGIANALSALIGVIITFAYTEEQIVAWAWRIPFIVGLLIIPVAIYIRRSLSETEDFLELKAARDAAGAEATASAATASAADTATAAEAPAAGPSAASAAGSLSVAPAPMHRTPLGELFRNYPTQMAVAALMAILWQVAPYALLIYATTYYVTAGAGYGFTPNEAFLASLIGNLLMAGGCIIAGLAADRVGLKRSLITTILVLMAVPVPAYLLLDAVPTLGMLIVVHAIICMAVAGFVGIVPSALTRMFPVAVRSSGTSVAYNIAAIFFAGFTPALMTWAIQYTTLAPGYYVVLAGVVALLTLPIFLRLIREQESRETGNTEVRV